jgi:threonine dehydrogenase-like Zn-dependent dehydrogenase
MQQIVQSLRNGTRGVASVPEPIARPGTLLVANAYSLISAGTESMVTELAGKSLLGKARERPDQVRRVLAKIQEEGLLDTLRQVQTKLDQPATVGYPSAGIVLACGAGVQEFRPGDRVSSNGPHAEVVCVPKHLCARVPDGVPLDRAAFTMLGSIALHGVRLSRLQLGETALVVGLGLVGQLAVAMLKAQGCRVLAVDPDAARCDLALRMGADLARPSITGADTQALTGGLGVDAVLIAAAASSRAPMDLAADAVRKRGRIVLVGVVDLELDRRPFYFKECEFVVSCSYGPGRYDPDYEVVGMFFV